MINEYVDNKIRECLNHIENTFLKYNFSMNSIYHKYIDAMSGHPDDTYCQITYKGICPCGDDIEFNFMINCITLDNAKKDGVNIKFSEKAIINHLAEDGIDLKTLIRS